MSPSSQRVWIEILTVKQSEYDLQQSPSSQRVWIEINLLKIAENFCTVALFTEGVDWNFNSCPNNTCWRVALFTEGVDWNSFTVKTISIFTSRPLHRGCGLKS